MNVEKILRIIYFCLSLPHMAIMGKTHSNFSLRKLYCVQKGVVSDPKNCSFYFV